MNAPTRRGILAALPLAAVAPPVMAAGTVNPDAALIEKAATFIAFHREKEASTSHLLSKEPADWTEADHAVWDASSAWNTGWHEDVEEISVAEPTTREGLIAQAEAVLFFHQHAGDDAEGRLAWNFAESVLRVLGHPMPEWAA
jgi:hypothetical protein